MPQLWDFDNMVSLGNKMGLFLSIYNQSWPLLDMGEYAKFYISGILGHLLVRNWSVPSLLSKTCLLFYIKIKRWNHHLCTKEQWENLYDVICFEHS